MNGTANHSATYLRFCTSNDPAGRIAAHVDLAYECLVREEARRLAELRLREAVSDARGKIAA